MSLAQVVPVNPGDRIQSAVWNAEFQNILTHPIALISPTTGAFNFALQAHTGLLPSVISATSASAGQALVSTGGTAAAWGVLVPSFVSATSASAGQALISTGGATAIWGNPVATFTPTFTSTEVPLAAASVVTVPHGIGAFPSMVRVSLRCIASTGAYSTGYEIPVLGTVSEVNAAGRSLFYTVSSTNVFISAGTTLPQVLDPGTAAAYQVTSSSWAVIVRCWA